MATTVATTAATTAATTVATTVASTVASTVAGSDRAHARRGVACRPARPARRRPNHPAVGRAGRGDAVRVVARRPVRREPGRAPSAAAYRRRRAVVGILLAVFVACGIVLTLDVLAGSGGVPASAASGQPALVGRTVTAQPGDTLWSIAEHHRGEVVLTRYVDKLVDLNGGPSIQAGQAVVLP